MRALLDVNVLIALLDAEHASHHAAVTWYGAHEALGWASCPLTQNGCVRIMSTASYPGATSALDIAHRLRAATKTKAHEFWPDDISLLNEDLVDITRIHGPRQLTDAYLLALAVKHGGRLVTFDGGVAMSAVKGAKPRHIVAL